MQQQWKLLVTEGNSYARGRLSSTSYSWIAIDNTPGRWYWQINLGSLGTLLESGFEGVLMQINGSKRRVRTSQDRNAWICVDECIAFKLAQIEKYSKGCSIQNFGGGTVCENIPRVMPQSLLDAPAVLAIPQPDTDLESEESINQERFCLTDLRSSSFSMLASLCPARELQSWANIRALQVNRLTMTVHG